MESLLKSRIAVSNSNFACSSIVAVPSEDKLLAQIGYILELILDSYLHILSLRELKSVSQPIKGITTYCCDSQIHSPFEIVVSTRKTLSIYKLDSKLELAKEISTPETFLVFYRFYA